MKIAAFSDGGSATAALRLGVVTGDSVVDLSGAAGLSDEQQRDLTSLLLGGDAAMNAVRAAADLAKVTHHLGAIQLHAPVAKPGKILAIGLNYGDHIEESGMKVPKHQMWFNKQHNCINAPYADIALPTVSDALDYEAELCLVIGKRCKHVPRERAAEVIGGYFCGNDVSVRDWQMRAQTMQIGKSFDTHGPTGPFLVTPDEVGDPHNLEIRAWVNGEERQHSNTRHLIFDCFDAIAHLTQAFTLDVGDVLFMGTPAGVGVAMKPPKFLKEGDVVKVEIEKLGFIENRVAREAAACIIE